MQKQLVVFKLNEQEYGVDISRVQEITEMQKITTVPNTPEFVEGIINLRGKIVPIISIKKRFQLSRQDNQQEQRIIIINLDDKQVGYIVDDASQVLTLEESQIEKPPDIIAGIERHYITGIGKTDDKIIVLLDLEKVLSEEEKQEIQQM